MKLRETSRGFLTPHKNVLHQSCSTCSGGSLQVEQELHCATSMPYQLGLAKLAIDVTIMLDFIRKEW